MPCSAMAMRGDHSAVLRAALRNAKPGSVLPAAIAGSAARMNSDGDKAAVLVLYQGSGIHKTELKDIFKRFHRVPGPTARMSAHVSR